MKHERSTKEQSVSVWINNFNYGRYLGEAIDSVLNQSEPANEILVVDDGSTDNSGTVLDRYNGRVIVIRKGNGGQASCFNAAFRASKADIICLLDSDDMFLPNKILEVKRSYAADPIGWHFHEMDLLHPDGSLERVGNRRLDRIIDERRSISNGRPKARFPATSGLTFRRDVIETLLPMAEARGVTIGDHYLKFGAAALSIGRFGGNNLGIQRIHDNNHYSGTFPPALRAEIQIRTARALAERVPKAAAFCDNLAGSALANLRRGEKEQVVEALIEDYQKHLTFQRRWRMKGWAFAKRLLQA